MKKFAKVLFALLIVCCLVFAGMTVLKVQDKVDVLNDQLAALEAERDLLLNDNAALNEQLSAANALAAEKGEALAAKDAELAEANTRLEHAESTLNDALLVVQSILEGLDNSAEEAAEAPAEEELPEAEAAEEAVTEEAPAAEEAAEAPVAEAAEVTEEPAAEETVDSAPAEEQPAEEAESTEEVPAE